MENILVPTDFSMVSRNAVEYAIQLAKSLNIKSIILYNSYQAPVIAEPTLPAIQIIDFDTLKGISESGLEYMKKEMLPLTEGKIEIKCLSEFGILDNSINEICSSENAGIIVMGISGGSELEEVMIGSTATSVARHTHVPVIIVPPQAKFSPLKHMVLACDFKKVDEGIPVAAIRTLLQITNAHLTILHIEEHENSNDNYGSQKQILSELFKGHEPAFEVHKSHDFVEGVNEFSENHEADVIITLPRKHGIFERLFKRSHTKHLAFHTNIPLMCIHQDD